MNTIKTKEDYSNALARIDELMNMDLDAPGGDELESLINLVEEYEDIH